MIAFTEDLIIQSIATAVLDDSDMSELITRLDPKHFSLQEIAEQYETLLELYSSGELNSFQVRKRLPSISDTDIPLYGDSLLQAISDVKNEYKTRMFKSVIQLSNEKANNLEKSKEIDTLIESLNEKLQEILLDNDSERNFIYNSLIQNEIERFYKAEPKKMQGVNTGDRKLNYMLSGYQRKDLIVIGARPSMGKTAFGLFQTIEMALRGVRVGFFSLEMSVEQITTRIFSYLANKDSMKVRSGEFNESEKDEAVKTVIDVGELPIYINDEPSLTPIKMRGIAKLWKAKHQIDVIIIDYLQYMSTDTKFATRNDEVGYISKKCKALAKELNIPIIALAQLSRANEKRQDKKPILSDLRDSGNIEQDADVIMFLHRPDYYEGKSEIVSDLHINIAKNRNGLTGDMIKKYDKATGRMYAVMAAGESNQETIENNNLPF